MALSQTQLDKLAYAFNHQFTDNKRELGNRLREEYEYEYDQAFADTLNSEGFPTPVSYTHLTLPTSDLV